MGVKTMSKELLSVKNDYVFKRIFGDAKNTDVLADFLMSVLDMPMEEFAQIQIEDPHLQRRFEDDKLGILDVRIHTTSGNTIEIEIQVDPIDSMTERMAYYCSSILVDQVRRGDEYTKIERVISIVIADFIMIEDSNAYHNRYYLCDRQTGSIFSDVLEINTLELSKLPETADSKLVKWLKFIGAKDGESMEELAKENPMIGKATAVLREMSEDEAERMIADAREKDLRDRRGAILFGERKGEAKGSIEKAVAIARNLKIEGIPVETITKATGLSVSEIEEL
jgi:predicted transposase/invertase (TIGR01784 family)